MKIHSKVVKLTTYMYIAEADGSAEELMTYRDRREQLQEAMRKKIEKAGRCTYENSWKFEYSSLRNLKVNGRHPIRIRAYVRAHDKQPWEE